MTINTSLTIRDWLTSATAQLAFRVDDPYQDAKRDAEVLLSHVINKNSAFLRAFDDTVLSDNQITQLGIYLDKRLNGEPIAYILGEREFWSLPLKVNASTLIPRADTECLVECVLGMIAQKVITQPLDILDLGTGTGAIAFALAKELQSSYVIGVDKSADVVLLAKENKQSLHTLLGGFENIEFLQSDWFSVFHHQADLANSQASQEVKRSKRFDLIISNPPYIAKDDQHLLQGDVRFEPKSALVAEENGLADIKTIIDDAVDYLKPNGWLMLEHGWQQADDVAKLLKMAGYQNISSQFDYAQQLRFTLGNYPTLYSNT